MANRAFGPLSLLAILLVPTTGCFTAIKHAYYEARGAQGEVKLLQEIGPHALASYNEVRFEPASTTVGPKFAPAALIRSYDLETAGLRTELSPYFPGGTPVLSVETEILYFQEKGLLSGALLLARVKMRDQGRVVADAIVAAESKSFRAGGEEDLAKAAAHTLVKFLEKQKGAPEKTD